MRHGTCKNAAAPQKHYRNKVGGGHAKRTLIDETNRCFLAFQEVQAVLHYQACRWDQVVQADLVGMDYMEEFLVLRRPLEGVQVRLKNPYVRPLMTFFETSPFSKVLIPHSIPSV